MYSQSYLRHLNPDDKHFFSIQLVLEINKMTIKGFQHPADKHNHDRHGLAKLIAHHLSCSRISLLFFKPSDDTSGLASVTTTCGSVSCLLPLTDGNRLCFAPLEIIMHALWALQRDDKIKRASAELNNTRDKNTDPGDIAGVFLQHSLQIRVLECLGMGAKEKKWKKRRGSVLSISTMSPVCVNYVEWEFLAQLHLLSRCLQKRNSLKRPKPCFFSNRVIIQQTFK